MLNTNLRTYAKEKGVCFWQIAKVMGISEPTMTRRLREELSEQDKAEYIRIIDDISAQSKTAADE